MSIPDELWLQWREFVEKSFAILVSETQMEQFKTFLAALVEWNEKMNLVSFHSQEEILWRHFADSLAGAYMIRKYLPCPERTDVIDIGTGAGFPGIPVKIVLPDIRLTLLESITKKCAFMEEAINRLGFNNVSIVNDRAEVIGQTPAHRASYNAVLSRAVAKFSPNLEIAVPLARREGRAFIFKTESAATGPEGLPSVGKALATLKAAPDDRFCYTLPGTDHRYCILSFKKTSDTPPQYPRRVGIPEKKPL